jgi:nucleotide-binding universal stress UspA family protein
MFKRILIAYDGSEHSKRAAQLAGEFARKQENAELWLVCVMALIPINLGEPYITEIMDQLTKAGEELIEDAKKVIGEGIPIHEELMFGSPAESILEVEKTRNCDLIIMGTRGMSGLQSLLLGSQVNKVIIHSKCPVLAVK